MNGRVIAGGLVLASASVMTFIGVREGTRLDVYADVGGNPTVCDGVLVKGVAIGTHYTHAQCDDMTRQAVERHAAGVASCTVEKGATLKQHEFDAFVSLAYNVGVSSVCATCLPGRECLGDLIRGGKMVEACERIVAYGKVRIDGALRDCADPQWQCRGVWLRRKAERAMCRGEPAA